MNQPLQSPTGNWRGAFAATLGNVLEWYDFLVFGFLSLIIAKQFFPSASEYASLMLTTATFGAGFLVRPLGGLVLGMYADRKGRKAGLTLVIALMTVASAIIAFTPSYRQIGVVAPALVLLARLLQGFSAGGEFGAATAMLIEFAPKKRRYLYGSWQMFSQTAGVLIAIGMGSMLTHFFTPDALESWAWRIPFLFGLLIGPVGFYIRRNMPETEAFINREVKEPVPLRDLFTGYPRELFITLAVAASGTVMSYEFISYLPIYAVKNLHMPASLPFDVLLATILLRMVCGPLFGVLADKIGGRRLFAWGLVGHIVTLYPGFMWIVSAPSMTSILITSLVFGFLMSMSGAPVPAMLAELFPTEIRSTGLAISYNVSTSLFGGFSPLVVTWLLQRTGNNLVLAHYCAIFFVLGLVALFMLRRQPVYGSHRAGAGAELASATPG
jgi:MHS family proline/betaine transporter-like MFS transporter